MKTPQQQIDELRELVRELIPHAKIRSQRKTEESIIAFRSLSYSKAHDLKLLIDRAEKAIQPTEENEG